MLTNVNTYIEKMHMDVKSVRIDLEAKRQSDPPVITEIHYKLVFDSPEPKNRLETLHDLSLRYGTVVNTVINGIQPQGTITTKQEDDDAASS